MAFDNAGANDVSAAVSLLISSGVTSADTLRYVCSVTKAHSADSNKIGVFELCDQGVLTRAARRYRGVNVQGSEVLDLRAVRPDGVHWDFGRKYDRQFVMTILREQRPRWIISSPSVHGL